MSSSQAPRLADVLREAEAVLAAAGVASPRADAELLAAHLLGVNRSELAAAALRGEPLDDARRPAWDALLARRAAREPLQHLTGQAPFRRLVLAVGPGVFVPRPETEVLAALAIEEASSVLIAAGRALVVDLCTGSGAIALAVADEVPAARVIAVEREPAALAWARRNVEAHGCRVELRAGDVLGDLVGAGGVLADLVEPGPRVDVLTANPPYIPVGAVPLEPEVAGHDPAPALYGGGADGMRVPAAVLLAAAALLRPGGLLLMEHADVQGAQARALAEAAGLVGVRTVADLAGRDRVLLARSPR